jgi:hypothetical protein
LNTYGYVGGKPLRYIDPLGLWSVSVKFFYGFGGTESFGKSSNGKWFITGGAGVGLGAGIKWTPNGDFPKPDNGTQICGQEGYIGVKGSVGASLGPLAADLSGQTGAVIGKDSNGDLGFHFTESGGAKGSIKGKAGWGIGVGGGLTVGGGFTF